MPGKLAAVSLLTVTVISAQPAAAVGDMSGVAIGAIIGETVGKLIAEQGEKRSAGYWWFRGACFTRHPSGAWMRVKDSRCE